VPKLTGVLTDSHPQVRAAANSNLLKFGEVDPLIPLLTTRS
jgi:hypothetical protein